MPKYAPAREDGLKPWIVTRSEWGRKSDHLIYAETSAAAKYECIGRQRHVYGTVRRATPEDVDASKPKGEQ